MSHVQRNIVAIIPASGVGSRMNAGIPKQYLKIGEKTILEHTVMCFLTHPQISKIVVAVSKTDPFYTHIPLLQHAKIQIVFGGKTRAESVFNALHVLNETDWALVHDAARPCLKQSDLDKILQIQSPCGAILAIPAVDTIKRANDSHIMHTEDRSTLWLAQTPQFFPAKALKQALSAAFAQQQNITDEASAMEFAGYHPLLVSGRSDNIKITRPEDLALAEFYLTRGTTHYDENWTRL